ncbi:MULTISPECIES: xanthine dehydrogenase family protein molybdopterin-binding subunit [unclassified Azospirillum]|uniref:xanthine dehydrogenase family protein molybdopterin-binding subunit n=1 Tax=unclassified Azospirillum TaxID=2630922 RepID=UPI000B638950|nr:MULTISPECIES: molybdopterin cofactor-binding domain-containing protein [unclassified Azospirillum]SNS36571.1 isoquinoline 1-oxidoreductase, beta subunit [Azospirillum sp. RU38E]SNS54892.1 isoquinoline 1-oxidoreductase, beta subunit [Azospirillum sp. RU37A]
MKNLPQILRAAAADVVEAAPSRRSFLKGAAGAGGALVIGAVVPLGAMAARPAPSLVGPPDPRPNVFVRVAPDSSVTVLVKHLDKGQGIMTGLTTIVAEELDADWAQMRGEFAPADSKLYANHAFGMQGTGGSTAVFNSWDELRMAGAAARAMLVDAAAAEWKVPASEITVAKGVISHAKSGKSGPFGPFAAAAAKLPVPASVKLKDKAQYSLIGNETLHRLDHISKTNGTAIFAMDIRRPGQVTAVLARAPRFGATVKSVDDKAARAIHGVLEVLSLPIGVAVVAKNTWTAIKGREALNITWDDSQAEKRGTDQMLADYRELAKKPGAVATAKGDTAAAIKGAAKVIEAEYSFPYLAHAPMEPLNAVVELTEDGGAEFWAGSQFQGVEQRVAAGILGTTPDKIKINTVWAGGSFGRRATPTADYMAETVIIAKALAAKGKKAPVHLVWTREDDIKGGRYRPLVLHKLRAGLDAKGNIVGWEQRIVTQSFMAGTGFEAVAIKNGVDNSATEGVADLAYKVPNLAVDMHIAKSPVTTLWWRSVGHTHTAYAKEAFIDELAAAAGKDAVAYRLGLLEEHPRLRGVLKLAADKAGWGKPLAAGPAGTKRGRGVAVHESFSTYVAHVAEVTIKADGKVKVDRVVVAVDCGIAVNPNVIKAQIEGGTGWGIGHALRDAITLTDGIVDQANFDTFEPLRYADMPAVEVHIVDSAERPTGVGEPGVPGAAPAVANAIAAAGGKRLYDLPFSKAGIV